VVVVALINDRERRELDARDCTMFYLFVVFLICFAMVIYVLYI
jgi:hypothetical protein